jgi:hypothetical protein
MPSSNDGVYWTHYYPHLTGGSVGQYGAGMQDRRFRMLHMKLTEIAQNRFKWEGFPPEVQLDNTRWLEKCLFETALAVFYYDPEWSRHFIMRAAPSGVWNLYGNPTQYLAYGNQYYNKWLDADDCVPIWANNVRYPDFEIVNIYAEVLSELDQTIAINAKNARRTKVIRVSEKSRLSFDNIQRDIDAGKSFIKVLTDLPNLADAMEAIDLGIDSKISLMDMSMLRSRVWNEAQTMLGVNNNQGADKKERLVADEVSGNDEQVMMVRETSLAARELACEQIKDKFGFEVTVRFATELSDEEEKEQMDKEIKIQAAKAGPGPQKALTK